MIQIIEVNVGSKNPCKVNAVKNVFALHVTNPVLTLGHDAPSKVSDMPFGMHETMQGAINRALFVWKPGTIAIGIEGGVVDDFPDTSKMFPPAFVNQDGRLASSTIPGILWEPSAFCMAFIVVIDLHGRVHYSWTSGMTIPSDIVAEARRRKMTTGKVLVERYGGDHSDPRAILTFNRAHRQDSIEEALTLPIFNIF